MTRVTVDIEDMVCLRAAVSLRLGGRRRSPKRYDPLYIINNGVRLLAAAHGFELIDRALVRVLRGAL